MKLKTKRKKIIIAFVFILILCTAFIGSSNNSVFAKINELYGNGTESGTIDIEQASDDSTVLAAVGQFLYAIAGWVEDIVGWLIGSFTGSNIFPWADRVIFNTIPFLDINFLSPSTGSMFRDISGENTVFGDIIANTYMTIFTLAIAFFGVAVGIMALKLAISSIASEKAKYKQAIMNWLVALILVFTVHYLISFILFVNEKMVEVASSILKTQIEQNEEEINLDFGASQDPESAKKVFNRFFEMYYFVYDPGFLDGGRGEDVYMCPGFGDMVTISGEYWGAHMLPVKFVTNGTKKGDSGTFKYEFFKRVNKDCKIENDGDNKFNFTGNGGWDWSDTQKATEDVVTDKRFLEKFQAYLSALCSTSTYITNYRDAMGEAIDSETGWFHEFDDNDAALRDIRRIINDALFLTNYDSTLRDITGAVESSTMIENSDKSFVLILEQYINASHRFEADFVNMDEQQNYPIADKDKAEFEKFKNIFLSIKSRIDNASNVSYAEKDILTNMSEFFKNNVYISNVNEDADFGEEEEVIKIKFQPIVAILYAIFIIQSIMYFIAYMKRFFYIIILALFAPIVIIYDFLMKSSMT